MNTAIKRRLKLLERSLAERPDPRVENLLSLSDAELQAVIDNCALPGSNELGTAERRFRMDSIATLTDGQLLAVIHGSSQGRSYLDRSPGSDVPRLRAHSR